MGHEFNRGIHIEVHPVSDEETSIAGHDDPTIHRTVTIQQTVEHEQPRTDGKKEPWLVLPFFAVIGSASMGLLSFLDITSDSGSANVRTTSDCSV